jgi:hypothetical protein
MSANTDGLTGPSAGTPSRGARHRGRRRAPRRARLSHLRWAGLALVVVLVWPAWSVSQALTAPGTDTVPARLAEWARAHGMDWAVTGLERLQYDVTQPSTGGTVAGGIPTAAVSGVSSGSGASHTRATATAPAFDRPPAPLTSLATPPLPGEGTWRPLLRVGGHVAARVAFLRPDRTHTAYLAGVVWMDPHLLSFSLHPGYTEPGPVPGAADQIPRAARGSVLATFYSGFRLQDAHGGYWQNGHPIRPLATGGASMVLTRGGGLDVRAWPGGRPGPGVVAVRQNLHLLIDGGALSPLVANPSTAVWGKTVGNQAFVWRSGVGVRPDGSVVFAVGPAMSVASLAAVLQDAGAVRAMELDINKDWTNYLTYTHPSAGTAVPHKLLQGQVPNPYRYLQPSSRDFVAVAPR